MSASTGAKNQDHNKMPLYKTIHYLKVSTTQILVWKITESYTELLEEVILNDSNRIRLDGMKSEMHQRGFLSVRKLLQETGIPIWICIMMNSENRIYNGEKSYFDYTFT